MFQYLFIGSFSTIEFLQANLYVKFQTRQGGFMDIRMLYASLSVFYLKLYQYEKYLDNSLIESAFEETDEEINKVLKLYNNQYKLSDMTVMDILCASKIETYFKHRNGNEAVQRQLNIDCKQLQNLRSLN